MNYTKLSSWLQKYTWRLGVFITLTLGVTLAVVAANEIIADMHPVGAQFISNAISAGMFLMVASFTLAFLEWLGRNVPRWWKKLTRWEYMPAGQ